MARNLGRGSRTNLDDGSGRFEATKRAGLGMAKRTHGPKVVAAIIVGLTSGAAMAAGAPWYVVLGAWAVLGALGLIVWALDQGGEP